MYSKTLLHSYIMVDVVLVCWFVDYSYVLGVYLKLTVDVWSGDHGMIPMDNPKADWWVRAGYT